jgi:hypothetical protein
MINAPVDPNLKHCFESLRGNAGDRAARNTDARIDHAADILSPAETTFRIGSKAKDMEGRPFTEEEISKIVANPFYCLSRVHPIFAQHHETLITEDAWIGAAAAVVKDMGAEKFLRLLLENLKGNFVAS